MKPKQLANSIFWRTVNSLYDTRSVKKYIYFKKISKVTNIKL